MNISSYERFVSAGKTADSLFGAINNQQQNSDSMSNSALQRGIDAYTKGDIDTAIKEFRYSIGMSPYSSYSLDTHQYLANAYMKQGKTEEAIKVYKQASALMPTEHKPHFELGTIYYRSGRYGEAENEYKMAVRLSPNMSENRFALGQVYQTLGKNEEAINQFKRVTELNPKDPTAYDSIGQVYRTMGNYTEAVSFFEKSISVRPGYADAHLDLGYTYADMGNIEEAQKQVDYLADIDEEKSSALRNYIQAQDAPKIAAAYSLDGFSPYYGRNTQVSSLDPSLSGPYSTEVFTMKFVFNKPMDETSVQNPFNWNISRADGSDRGGAYNWGLEVPSTEVTISAIPESVKYDSDGWSADVNFRITQNETADGTIDPSHIIFRFSGVDSYGKYMDPSGDEYGGISKVV